MTDISDKTKSGAIAKYNYLMYVKEQIKYLPELFGTKNQIRYAENLRKKDMQNFIYRLRDSVLSGNSSLEIDGNKLMQEDFLKATEYVLDIQDSKFWIENDYRLRSNLFKIIKSTNMFFDIKNGNISPKGFELPELKGSEKQINWAKSIRNSFIYGAFLKLSDFNFSPSPNLDERIDGVIKINKKLFGNSEAKFWIDNRDYFYYDLAEKVAQQIIKNN